ncbi:MAG: hypothetical protein WKF30_05495, partial [Pyrinomonadaceae bacterium]
MSAKLGELLVRENFLSAQQLRSALDHQRTHGGRLSYNLVKLGLVQDEVITTVLSRQYGVPSVNLSLFDLDLQLLALIPREVAERYCVLPLSRAGATLTLAMADPTNVAAMDDIKFMTGLNIEPVVVSEGKVRESIGKYYNSSTREIELAPAVNIADDPLSPNGNSNGHGANGKGRSAITKDDLVSLDQLDLDADVDVTTETVEVSDNEEIDLSNIMKVNDAPVVRLVNVVMVDA